MFKNILISLDGSKPADAALAIAIDVARTYGARLHVVHVLLREYAIDDLREVAERAGVIGEVSEELSHVEVVPAGFAPGADVPIVVIPDAALEKLGDLLLAKGRAAAKSAGLQNLETRIIDDEPAPGILGYAAEQGIDLIVTGSRGRGPLKTLILGSVSHDLIEGAKCPCLIVKESKD